MLQRFWEIILGLDKGFLSKSGEFSIQYNPKWPWQDYIGARPWNFGLVVLAGLLIWWVYPRDGQSRTARIILGAIRACLLAFVIVLLNRPSMTLTETRSEPSYLAVLVDNSLSMGVRDAGVRDNLGVSRMEAVKALLDNDEMVRKLLAKNILRFYSFNRDAQALGTLSPGDLSLPGKSEPTSRPLHTGLEDLQATGQSTQILTSLRTVLQDLQGRRLAGVVVLTDGRSTPQENIGENLKAIRGFQVPIYPIAVGSEKPARNLAIESIEMQEDAFARDIVSAKVKLHSSGFPQGQSVHVVLKDKATNEPLIRSDNKPAELDVVLDGTGNQDVEINFQPRTPGTLQIAADVAKEPGEVDYEDNTFPAQIAVIEAKIKVLYVDGYPRWEYRYLKDEMIRPTGTAGGATGGKTVEISCLLLSADKDFAQEGDAPITRFPETFDEIKNYDVVIFGDVDPRQFADSQLHLISDFVAKRNGGFGLIAGPRWSPYSYRNTPIANILPVDIARNSPGDPGAMTMGWRPVLTKVGEKSTIFRFYEDKARNAQFIKDEIQPLFWYARGISAKPDVGEVYAEHPTDLGPDGHKAPLLVLGHFGGGNTLFSAIDDSWRWRYYTGESVFYTYWIQQLRYLARAHKLGQRQFSLTAERPSYELGQQAQIMLRILDPDLQRQLPDQLSVTIVQKNADGTEQAVREERLQKRQQANDLYVASFTADLPGQFVARVNALVGFSAAAEAPLVMKAPRLELLQPDVDRVTIMSRLSNSDSHDADGPDLKKLDLPDTSAIPVVRAELQKIPSVAVDVPVFASQLLWNAPLAMLIFVLLVTAEWVIRKGYGML